MFVARILHVEDSEAWRDLIKARLSGHHVDSAASLEDAVALLGAESPYQVALVDLNLKSDSDEEGGDLLDLIRMRYPATRRIVVTGNPPPGSLRRTIFERYDVEEIIIKRDMDIPDLRRVVEEAVAEGPDGLSQSLRLSRSALRQRLRDWQRIQADKLRIRTREAEEHLYDARKVSVQSGDRAEVLVEQAKRSESEFRRISDQLRVLVGEIKGPEDLNTAIEALDAAEDRFGDGLEGPRHAG
jgi:CheY-like chemotaxis protein